MSEISNIAGTFPFAAFVEPTPAASFCRESVNAAPIEDTVEISRFSESMQEVVERSSLRIAKTRAIRFEIAAGTYETPERIRGTVERLLDVIG